VAPEVEGRLQAQSVQRAVVHGPAKEGANTLLSQGVRVLELGEALGELCLKFAELVVIAVKAALDQILVSTSRYYMHSCNLYGVKA